MTMAIELKLLGAAIILGFIYWLADVVSVTAQRGSKWNAGNREVNAPLTGAAGRINRAFANFRETFAFFAVAVIVAYLGGKLGTLTVWGCWIYLIARAVYLPVYALGIIGLRSAVFMVGLVGTLMVVAAIFV
jgi:uncharacterized MAPEG superfamily protein